MRLLHALSEAWSWLLNLGAQVSGVQYPWVGLILIVIAIILGIIRSYRWIHAELAKPDSLLRTMAVATRRNLIPLMLWAMAAAGAILIVAAVIGGISYSNIPASLAPDEIAKITAPFQTQIDSLKQQLSQRQSEAPAPILKRTYGGQAKTILDKDLNAILEQLNGPGLTATSIGQKIAPNISAGIVETSWSRYAPIQPALDEMKAALDETESLVRKLIKEHPYQSEDLIDAVKGTEYIAKLRQSVDGLSFATMRLKRIFDAAKEDRSVSLDVAQLFESNKVPFEQSLQDFNVWVSQCNQRIEAKIRALNQ